jgi:glycosyltransferase involved in cell wall biosynthesis
MNRIAIAFFHGPCRALTLAQRLAVRAAAVLGRRRALPGGADILLTATFHSDNWIGAHIRPLAASAAVKRVRIVATRSVPEVEKVEAIYPPHFLRKLIGGVPARLAWFTWEALRRPADIIGGFPLLFNGLLTTILAKLSGARSLYFCVGGAAEVEKGGLASENRLFTKMRTEDAFVERRLLAAVSDFDQVITMGTAGKSYFEGRGVTSPIAIVSGGIDTQRFEPYTGAPEWDLVFVGRFAPIKRPDLFLRTVAELKKTRPEIRAVMLGDGVLRTTMETLAAELGVQETVTFAGLRPDVESYVRRSRIFVNTSDSEGLPLSVMEAMACGVPCVVSDVGDMRDLVKDGVNGHVVAGRTARDFADRIEPLLANPTLLAQFRLAARAAAESCEISAVAGQWTEILRAV